MLRKSLYALLLVLLGIVVVLAGCQTATPTPVPTPTSTPIPTYTPYPTHTPYPTNTPEPTYTPFPTWTPPPTATPTPEPTVTPTDTPTPTLPPTSTPLPTAIPVTSAPIQPPAGSTNDLLATMRTARQQVESLRNTIYGAMGAGYLNCNDWVTLVISIDATQYIDVSGYDERTRSIYDHFRQGIAIAMDGAKSMTEHCAKFLAGEDTKPTISAQAWTDVLVKVEEAIPYLDGAITALEQE